MNKFIFLIFYFMLTTELRASQMAVLDYNAGTNQRLEEIIKLFVKSDSSEEDVFRMIRSTKANNSHIPDWNRLSHQTFKLFLIPENVNRDEYVGYKKFNRRILHFYAGLMPAVAFYEQKSSDGFSAQYTQKSIASVNLGFKSNLIFKSLYSISGEFTYMPLIRGTTVNLPGLSELSIDFPAEIESQIIVNYDLKKTDYSLFAGADYDRFSIFDQNGITTANQIYLAHHNLFYLTLGVSKNFHLSNKKLTILASVSKSITSSYSSDYSSSSKNADLSGFKFSLKTSFAFQKNWILFSKLSYKKLEGIDEISLLRIGAGISYNFY